MTAKSKKELKEEYKQRTPPMGVFQIRNTQNGKIFVGKAFDLTTIWGSQQLKLDWGDHTNSALQEDWKKYGNSAFTFEILHEISPSADPSADQRADLETLEGLTIEELKPYDDRGYNVQRKDRTQGRS